MSRSRKRRVKGLGRLGARTSNNGINTLTATYIASLCGFIRLILTCPTSFDIFFPALKKTTARMTGPLCFHADEIPNEGSGYQNLLYTTYFTLTYRITA